MNIETIWFYDTALRILESGRAVVFHAKGGSMEPFVHDGEEVRVERREEYHPGDVVLTVTSPERKVVMHYIAEDTGEGFTLMGSANLMKREWCQKGDVAGRMVAPSISRRIMLMWHKLLPVRLGLMFAYRKMLRWI